MFYGNLGSPEAKRLFEQMLRFLADTFGKVTATDNNLVIGKISSFLDEPRFNAVLERAATNDQERSLVLRLNTLIWAWDHAFHLNGDLVECGVYKGFCSRFLAEYFDLASRDRTLWLYDTFSGFPDGQVREGLTDKRYREPGIYEAVVDQFRAYPNVRIIPGAVPDSLGEGPSSIAFLHLDMNSSQAEIAALDHLFDRIVSGGMVVFDDYGWARYSAQHFAEKAWAAERGYRILETPNGQGILLKR